MERTDLAKHDAMVLKVPITSLAGESRCRACQLFWVDQEAFADMTDAILRGEHLSAIAERLNARGHRFTCTMLTRHKNRHMKPVLWELASETKQLEIIARVALEIPSGDLATAMIRLSAAALMQGLKAIKPAALQRIASEDPSGFLQMTREHAKAMASVQAADNRARLAEIKLRLEAAKAEAQCEAALTRAMAALKKELMKSPKGMAIYQALTDFANAPSPQAGA